MAAELVDRLAILVAVRRFPGMGAAPYSRSLRSGSYVRMQNISRTSYVLFWRFGGDVRREFMQRLCAALHGTMGSYLRDALQEGSADAVAYFQFLGLRFFPRFFFFPSGFHCFFLSEFDKLNNIRLII
jgi:hypothetical protein